MKSILFTALFSLFTVLSFAQDREVIREEFHKDGSLKLQFTQVDKHLVQAVYYYENGAIAQRGYFLNEQLYGYWESFDVEENKIATGFFANNQKTGTWNYWLDGELIQVISYSDNQMAMLH